MKMFRRLRHSVFLFGAGAVTAYFLDPEAGPERRDRLIEQFRSVMGEPEQPTSDGTAPEGMASENRAEWVSGQRSTPAASTATQNDAADAFPDSAGFGDQSP